jgi:hypothetical protein
MLASFGRFRAAALPLGFMRVMLVGFATARWRTLAAAVESAGGFLISNGALVFSCAAPGPPWRMVEGDFVDVEFSASLAILLMTLVRGVLFGVAGLPLLMRVLGSFGMQSRIGFGIGSRALRTEIGWRNW